MRRQCRGLGRRGRRPEGRVIDGHLAVHFGLWRGGEAEVEGDESEDSEAAEGAAAAASLLKLKEEGLEKLGAIKSLYAKARAVLLKKGSQDKTYLKYQEKISEEMMGIRFTSKTIERLCD